MLGPSIARLVSAGCLTHHSLSVWRLSRAAVWLKTGQRRCTAPLQFITLHSTSSLALHSLSAILRSCPPSHLQPSSPLVPVVVQVGRTHVNCARHFTEPYTCTHSTNHPQQTQYVHQGAMLLGAAVGCCLSSLHLVSCRLRGYHRVCAKAGIT